MCRTSQALYVWCQCEEAHILETCHSGRSSASGSCDSVASGEVVYLQCFCRYHATKGFTTAHKDQQLQKKADRKKNKRRSMDSTLSVGSSTSDVSSSPSTSARSSSSAARSMLENSPSRFRKSWAHIRKLSFA